MLSNDVLLTSPFPLILWPPVESLKSATGGWFVNECHKSGLDSLFQWLSRQEVGKLQPVDQVWALPVFVKVLLEHSCAHLLIDCPGPLSHYNGRDCMAHTVDNILLSGPLEWKFADPWLRLKKAMETMLKIQIKHMCPLHWNNTKNWENILVSYLILQRFALIMNKWVKFWHRYLLVCFSPTCLCK